MPTIQRPHGSLYYEVSGSGPPLVCLRGLGRSTRHWLGYDQELSGHFRVLTLDMRGMGQSTLPHRPLDSMATLSQDVADIMDAAQMGSAHIMGVSLGGMVALSMGLTQKARCKSLIVINSSIAGQGLTRMSMTGVRALVRGKLRKGSIHKELATVLVGSGMSSSQLDELAKTFESIERDEGPKDSQAARQLIAAARFRVGNQLKKMDVPTLVIYGEEDSFVPIENSKRIFSLLPIAELLSVPNGGHELFVDQGQVLTNHLRDWVGKQPY